MSENNLEFWDKVATSNRASLKQVNQRGGFTAISAQYQIKRATEIWGQYGDKWGMEDLAYNTQEYGEKFSMFLTAKFFYPNIKGEKVIFEISGDMEYKVGQDCNKKLLTDLTTKALSKLGFNADVFLNQLKWDGNKYIDSELKEEPQKSTQQQLDAMTVKGVEKTNKLRFDKLQRLHFANKEKYTLSFLAGWINGNNDTVLDNLINSAIEEIKEPIR